MKRINGWQAAEIRTEWNRAELQTFVAGDETIRGKNISSVEYGIAQEVVGTGRATCRACGQKIAKGAAALRFPWDTGCCGSFTATNVQIHLEECCEQ